MPTLRYYGHSTFLLHDDKYTVALDPFFTGNSLSPITPEQVRQCDFVLVTHGHGDHLGDTLELAGRCGATVVATYELANYCAAKGAEIHPMAPGGAHEFPFGTVKMVEAVHGCGGEPGAGGGSDLPNTPSGFLVTWKKGGKTLYHAGDTALFGDMKLIGERHRIDVALLPIGDNFTMGVADAAYAAELLRAELNIPMHYDTFEVIKADPQAFAYRVEKAGLKAMIMKPGEKITF